MQNLSPDISLHIALFDSDFYNYYSQQVLKTGHGYKLLSTSDVFLIHHAIKFSKKNILIWVYKSGYKFTDFDLMSAVLEQKIDMIKFLIQYGAPMSESVSYYALCVGNITILNLLRDLGCKFDSHDCTVAYNGGIDTIKWAREIGLEWGYAIAYDCEKLDTYRWAKKNGAPWFRLYF